MKTLIYSWIGLIFLFAGCNNQGRTVNSSNNESKGVRVSGSTDIYYKSLFGDKYLTQGGFLAGSIDNAETGLWTYTNLDTPLVLSGHYVNGMQTGVWSFVLNDGKVMSSQWKVYKNRVTPCVFSLPFNCEELYADSFSLRLRTMNDSLGKIGIMVQIRDTALEEEDLIRFGMRADTELHSQGYSFTSNEKIIEKDKNRYFFYEYFLKDSVNKEAKVYYFFGNTLSRKHFVLFTLFHQGVKENLVKIICNLIASSLYIDNERFYIPYETAHS